MKGGASARQRGQRARVRLNRRDGGNLGSGGGPGAKIGLQPALASSYKCDGTGKGGGSDGYQLVNHGFPIVTDSA